MTGLNTLSEQTGAKKRGIALSKKKISPLVVLTRTTLLPGFYIEGSRKGHDCMVNSAPFVLGQMEESLQFVGLNCF